MKNFGGMPNMQQLMKQAQKMQKQMEQAQAELETKELTATAGGGMVEVVITGKKEIKSMERTVMCLTRIYDEQAKYTPTVKELSEIKNDFDPYFYNTGIYV